MVLSERKGGGMRRLFLIAFALTLAGCGSAPASVESDEDGQLYFGGDECTEDCSGHQAGYDWAEEKGITDPEDCGGKSDSFIEGCETYAEEQQSELE